MSTRVQIEQYKREEREELAEKLNRKADNCVANVRKRINERMKVFADKLRELAWQTNDKELIHDIVGFLRLLELSIYDLCTCSTFQSFPFKELIEIGKDIGRLKNKLGDKEAEIIAYINSLISRYEELYSQIIRECYEDQDINIYYRKYGEPPARIYEAKILAPYE